MRILIIGAGAVGSFLGARLALGGADVVLAGRPAQAAALNGRLLALDEPGEPPREAAVTVAPGIAAALAKRDAYDLAFVTVKAYATAGVIAELTAAGPPVPLLLTMQNGVGNEEALAEAFGPDRVIAGAMDTPVSVSPTGEVHVHRARYAAGVAPVVAAAAGVAASAAGAAPVAAAMEALRSAGMQAQRFDDYRSLKWSKLLLNLPANASCAILGRIPAEIMADPRSALLEAIAWQEALRVMHGAGIPPVALAGYPLPSLALAARRMPASWLARLMGRMVAGGRGDKLPSLALALAARRPTEVPWLNGAVAERGAAIGISSPANRVLCDVLVGLTDGSEDPAAWAGRPDQVLERAGALPRR